MIAPGKLARPQRRSVGRVLRSGRPSSPRRRGSLSGQSRPGPRVRARLALQTLQFGECSGLSVATAGPGVERGGPRSPATSRDREEAGGGGGARTHDPRPRRLGEPRPEPLVHGQPRADLDAVHQELGRVGALLRVREIGGRLACRARSGLRRRAPRLPELRAGMRYRVFGGPHRSCPTPACFTPARIAPARGCNSHDDAGRADPSCIGRAGSNWAPDGIRRHALVAASASRCLAGHLCRWAA